MLSCIYGTNQVAIRSFILKLAKDVKASSIKDYNIDTDSVGSIESTLQTDIFGDAALNTIDVTKISKSQLEKLFDLLKRYQTANIILVSAKDLERTSPLIKVVSALKGRVVTATVARPNDVFRYLDDLYNKRETPCYTSLQKLLEKDNDPVYILVMLQYQLKNIALAKFGLTKKLSPFQISSSLRQAEKFSRQKILELYELLFKYDAMLKTGQINPEAVVILATQKILLG